VVLNWIRALFAHRRRRAHRCRGAISRSRALRLGRVGDLSARSFDEPNDPAAEGGRTLARRGPSAHGAWRALCTTRPRSSERSPSRRPSEPAPGYGARRVPMRAGPQGECDRPRHEL